ncbi:class F sortase [Pseudonocardia sp. KRD291]|uniref:class F sortase n=1 Tax=Pseudonocardia sp. KRD291 TaxID=2792007 RepID=UPI0027E22B97|nr:class F sortase [Pseudonocardia sp. KRD291]
MSARPRPPRLRLALRAAGLGAVACLAIVVVADPADAPTTDALRSASAATARSVAEPPAAAVLPESAPTRITVPSAGIDAPMIGLGLQPDGSMEVPSDGPTSGWFTGGPTPGELGPAVVAAHVNWRGRPGAFAALETVRPGAEIRVERSDGGTAVFDVRRVTQYPKSVFPTDEVYGDLDHAGLRLITCGGEFDGEARSYRSNVVVFADLRS